MHFTLPAPVIAAALITLPAVGVTTPFTETFDSNSAGWRDAGGGADIGWVPSGSFDGSAYATTSFNFLNSAADSDLAIARAQDGFNSSGDAFVGDWLASGVGEFSVWVRHDGPAPVNFFARFASSANFPGAFALESATVAANQWTRLTVSIDALNPQFVTFEGSDFNTVFSNIGNIQIGVRVPTAFAGLDQSITFDIDSAGISAAAVPAPASASILALAGFALTRRRR